MKGTIKKLIRDRGFGFIQEESGKELFFHRSALVDMDFDALEEGARVEFDTESGPKGMRAAQVKRDGS